MRVFWPSDRASPFIGTLMDYAGDTLTLSEAASARAIPIHQVARIDTSLGTRKATGTLGLAGLLIGGVAGAAVAALTSSDGTDASNIVGAALVGGGVGLGAGLYLENDLSGERWTAAWIPEPAPPYAITWNASSALTAAGAGTGSTTAAETSGGLWVRPGDKSLRVTRPPAGSAPLIGGPAWLGDSTLILRSSGKWTETPLREVERLEVNRGPRGGGGGTLIGLSLGAVAGAVIGAAGGEQAEGLSEQGEAITGALLLGLLGALIGHGLDSPAIAGKEWETIPPDEMRAGPRGELWVPLGSAQRIRVSTTLPDADRIVGTAESFGGDTLLLVRKGATVPVPRSGIRKVETSWRRKGHGLYGMILGCGLGLGIGAEEFNQSSENTDLALTIFAGATGAILGWIAGQKVTTACWEPIPLVPPPLRAVTTGRLPAPADSLGGGG